MDAKVIQAMADKLSIMDLIYRYCRAVDRIDHQLGYSVWHEDGTADYGVGAYKGSGHGFIDWVCIQHGQLLAHSHHVTNIIIELDGDRAASESYHFAALRIMRDAQPFEMHVHGRYLDQWSKRAGRWGIDHRLTVRDFDSISSVAPMSSSIIGCRELSDPSYQILRGKVE